MLEAIADLAVVACHNAEAYEDVRTAASTDALTGLLNHGAMQVRVREEIARAARDGQPLCCVLIDLDDFKRVNDELGHPAGDAFLRRVADALRAEVRPYDQLARYGGDEFVIVLPGTGEEEARAVAERVRDRVRERRPRGADGPIGGCSIGVSVWEAPMSAADLLAAADRGLYCSPSAPARAASRSPAPTPRQELDRLRDSGGSPAAVQALVAAIEARDNYSFDHSELVVRLATGVALLLGLPADAVERVGHGALLHDVGKLADPARDPAEGRRARRRRVDGHGRAPGARARSILRRIPAARPAGADRAPRARALGRQRLPRRARRHADPDRLADRPRLRRLRGDDRPSGPTAARSRPTTRWPSCAPASGSQFDPQVVEALLDLLGLASCGQSFAGSRLGRLRRRDQRRAVGQPRRAVLALVLRARSPMSVCALWRLRVVAGVAVAAGAPDVVLAEAERERRRPGRHGERDEVALLDGERRRQRELHRLAEVRRERLQRAPREHAARSCGRPSSAP